MIGTLVVTTSSEHKAFSKNIFCCLFVVFYF